MTNSDAPQTKFDFGAYKKLRDEQLELVTKRHHLDTELRMIRVRVKYLERVMEVPDQPSCW